MNASPNRLPFRCIAFAPCALLALGLALPAVAATPQTPAPRTASTHPPATQGIVITGDQEAPLVLYILPWEDTVVSLPPPAPMSDLIPDAVDHERTLLQDYDARNAPNAGDR